ncbi:MAG: hypothetical protein AAGA10_20090 [Bacteroidota bacterium]
MSFTKDLQKLQKKVLAFVGKSPSEAVTKIAFIQPFIQALGYDFHDPQEVIQGFLPDSIQEAERIGYCLCKSEQPILLISTTAFGQSFSNDKVSTLFSAYEIAKADFALLTNGLRFQFFADFERANQMDEEAFWDIQLDKLSPEDLVKLQAFSSSVYNVKRIKKLATTLVSPKALRELLVKELSNPSDSMVRFVLKSTGMARVTKKMIGEYRPLVKKSLRQAAELAFGERALSGRTFDSFLALNESLETFVHFQPPTGTQEKVLPAKVEVKERMFSLSQGDSDSLAPMRRADISDSLVFKMVQ